MPDLRVEAFWRTFAAEADVGHDHYDVVEFGDSPEMKTELATLVASGRKRATCGVEEKIIAPGDLGVVVDGAGAPVCVMRTTEVRHGPLNSVDERFALDEGEGDRSVGFWLAAHRAFLSRQAEREGWTFHDEVRASFERFEVVWPPELADTSRQS